MAVLAPLGTAGAKPARSAAPLLSKQSPRAGTRIIARFANSEQENDGKKVLLIGATGVTGRSAVEGLLTSGSKVQLLAMTRNTSSPAAEALKSKQIQVVGGNLDDSESLDKALSGIDMVYCHALSTDAAQADPAEVLRAERLAHAAARSGCKLIVYNSTGGRGCGYGISQMDQKHRVEDIFTASGVPLTSLQVAMFMEEFWKKYTRPPIINKGSFPFSIPGNKKLQLLAARDLGLVAGSVLADPSTWSGRSFEVAGDELTPEELCEVFSRQQPPGGPQPVKHSRPPAFLFWFLNKDLWKISRFLSDKGFTANVAATRSQFPGMLSFEEFLVATRWSDPSRSYEQGIVYDGPMPRSSTTQKVVSSQV
eukprot:CAMPEP_0202901822 /NCGR_PEP_ID=MMETSP1392-20130828/14840_1 /ASSEMBLY_ACC=CAM_ASM_000868 /TAXON_ID=225041 /ORGANISM="Chlamydomonas chlamydogama, Strain SAG 11-48b" /LENGTH=365 /DNA_ID=CAMNT_0049588447 /DNA_START=65 /DNA_END=1162 /DNA_ORIENTATION=-